MKTVYLDTNLYVALIKHNDRDFAAIQKIISQPHLSFVTSTLTLVELSSVLSRESNNLQLDYLFVELAIDKNDPNQLSSIILFIIDYLISKTKTTIISDSQNEIIKYFPQKFMMNPIYKIAMLESAKIKLRTLDLIHYANAFHYSTNQQTRIDYVLSGDQNFIKNARAYAGTKDLTFIDPDAFIKLECI